MEHDETLSGTQVEEQPKFISAEYGRTECGLAKSSVSPGAPVSPDNKSLEESVAMKSNTKTAQTKQEPNSQKAGRGKVKPALIKQWKLKKGDFKGTDDSCHNPNPFGIRVIKGTTLLTEEAVEYQFKEIKRIFFPNFDSKQKWSLFQEPSDWCIAYTFWETKTIMYTPNLLTHPILVLNVILIHELCHAELGARHRGHGKRWRDRMIEAADTAGRIRDVNLVFALAKEAWRYDPSKPSYYVAPINARNCYEKIKQLVNDEPDWQFEQVIYWVGRSCYEQPIFLIEKFKKCYEVFEKAKEQAAHLSVRRQKPIPISEQK
jgi:hypothetical protein